MTQDLQISTMIFIIMLHVQDDDASNKGRSCVCLLSHFRSTWLMTIEYMTIKNIDDNLHEENVNGGRNHGAQRNRQLVITVFQSKDGLYILVLVFLSDGHAVCLFSS